MPVTFDQGCFTAIGVDRLADAAQRPAPVSVGAHEVAPGRNDASRVSSDRAHVRELHLVSRSVESVAKRVDLRRVDDDEDGLVARHTLGDERNRRAEELVLARVEQRFVAKR